MAYTKQKKWGEKARDIVNRMVVEKLLELIEKLSETPGMRVFKRGFEKAAELVFDIVGWQPKQIKHDLAMPQGVASRAADLKKAREILGFEPKVSYKEGFKTTIDWYFANTNRDEVKANLKKILMER